MKLSNRATFTNWFGLATFGYILLALNAVATLTRYQLDLFDKLFSTAITVPALILLGWFGFLICRRLDDGERERQDLQEQVEAMRANQNTSHAN